jgi:hypothetical protein
MTQTRGFYEKPLRRSHPIFYRKLIKRTGISGRRFSPCSPSGLGKNQTTARTEIHTKKKSVFISKMVQRERISIGFRSWMTLLF